MRTAARPWLRPGAGFLLQKFAFSRVRNELQEIEFKPAWGSSEMPSSLHLSITWSLRYEKRSTAIVCTREP